MGKGKELTMFLKVWSRRKFSSKARIYIFNFGRPVEISATARIKNSSRKYGSETVSSGLFDVKARWGHKETKVLNRFGVACITVAHMLYSGPNVMWFVWAYATINGESHTLHMVEPDDTEFDIRLKIKADKHRAKRCGFFLAVGEDRGFLLTKMSKKQLEDRSF